MEEFQNNFPQFKITSLLIFNNLNVWRIWRNLCAQGWKSVLDPSDLWALRHESVMEIMHCMSSGNLPEITVCEHCLHGAVHKCRLELQLTQSSFKREWSKVGNCSDVNMWNMGAAPSGLKREDPLIIINHITTVRDTMCFSIICPSPAVTALFNSRLSSNKSFSLNNFVTSQKLDIFFVTEIWLKLGGCCALSPREKFLNSQRCSSALSNYWRKHPTQLQPQHWNSILNITNDILMSLDNSEHSTLVLLDVSAAFDTVDHAAAISRLQNCFVITGTALKWFSSYLSNRHFRVHINLFIINHLHRSRTEPKGSVLGPVLFSLEMLPLGQLINGFNGISYHCYADDAQLYFFCEAQQPQQPLLLQ